MSPLPTVVTDVPTVKSPAATTVIPPFAVVTLVSVTPSNSFSETPLTPSR